MKQKMKILNGYGKKEKMSKTILNGTESRRKIEALTRVFTKTDRVLSGEDIAVEVADGSSYMPNAPAWTDGKTITFNPTMIGEITTFNDLIRLSGLNYHELAHVLFTPRSSSDMGKWVSNEGMHNEFNMLEDQRIETFLTSMYPSVVPYLTSTFLRFCILNDEAWKGNYLLAYGRRYLPSDVRSEFRRRFIKPELLGEGERIIDSYRKLVYPKDREIGKQLVLDFSDLLAKLNTMPQDPYGHSVGQRPEVSKGRQASQSDQQEASDLSDDFDEDLDDQDYDEDSDSESDISDDDDNEDGDNNSNSGSGESNKSDDLENKSSDNKPESKGGDSGNHGETNEDIVNDIDNGKHQDLAEKFKKQMETAIKESENQESVKEDIQTKQRSINSGNQIGSKLRNVSSTEHNVFPVDVSLVRRFSAILDQLVADSDPGWETHSSSGKINIKRAMGDASYDDVWDRWEEGNNESSDIECVICIDVSGSMSYEITNASRALWVIKRALETVNANVTVISFANIEDTRIVYRSGESASKSQYKQLRANGCTEPDRAISEATHILEASTRTNKMLIAITDGAWSTWEGSNEDKITSENMILALNKIGVTTALAYIGTPYIPYGETKPVVESHNCSVVTVVDNSTKLVEFAKSLVNKTMGRK
jgi:Mg-chelatase subunit ChlD